MLPPNTSIQKDAVLALSKSATVFISYLAAHANELTTRKTISPADVLKAVAETELGGVMGLGQIGKDGRTGGRLERELEVFEEAVKGKRKGYREKVKKKDSVGDTTGVTEDAEGLEQDERGEPTAKKARRTSGQGREDENGDGHTHGPTRLSLSMNGSGGKANEGEVSRTDGTDEETTPEPDQDAGDGDGDEDENQEDDEEEDEEQDEEEQEADDDEEDDVDDPDRNGQLSMALAPNGREEVGGSEDDSD